VLYYGPYDIFVMTLFLTIQDLIHSCRLYVGYSLNPYLVLSPTGGATRAMNFG
jgi:hypothetical protein